MSIPQPILVTYTNDGLFLRTYGSPRSREGQLLMIAQSQVDEVRRLLATGKFSQRQIAELTKVSRGTINSIVNGKRRDHVRHVKKAEEWGPFDGPIQRCPDCGGRVHMPCRLCQARRQVFEDPITSSDFKTESLVGSSLEIELEGESFKIYEEFHQKRLLEDEVARKLQGWEEEDEDDEFLSERYFTSLLGRGEIEVCQVLI